MKIYLVKTPEYESENLSDVLDFLESFNGPVEFIGSNYVFSSDQFPFLKDFYPDFKFKYESETKKIKFDAQKSIPLSWKELFSLCDHYRNTFSIGKNDFIALITRRRNALNWFSQFDNNKNIFIHAGDWERYTTVNHKYPVAYQIIENMMQSLMNVDTYSVPNINVHTDSRGCMNDLCLNKEQIILKMRTADICPDCILKINSEKVEQKLLSQVFDIFEGVRNELLFKKRYSHQIQPVPILLDERRKLLLPQLNNIEIRLNPLFKTLYIFYLKHPEGIKLNELMDYKVELLLLYKKLYSSGDDPSLEARIIDLINPIGGSFSQKKSKINKIINNLLGEPLANFYRIEGNRGCAFKIKLSPNLIDIRY
jgi:hypothetical protein